MTTPALSCLSEPPRAAALVHEELRYRCPNCATRMQAIRAIHRGAERGQEVYQCPRCSVIVTEQPEQAA